MTLNVRKPRGGGNRVQVQNVSDFTGGLNLNADVFKLQPNESPWNLNVDVDRRGGFERRNPVQYVTETGALTGGAFVHAVAAELSGVGERLIAQVHDTGVTNYKDWNGTGTWSAALAPAGVPTISTEIEGKIHTASLNGVTVIQRNAEAAAFGHTSGAWPTNAVTFDPSGSSNWSNSYSGVSGTRCPKAKYIASHVGYMWVANIVEANGPDAAYPSRVRWSHPNNTTQWRANDWVDVDVGDNSDGITGIVPFRDHLLVFKNRSIHAIYGYSPDTFQVVRVADDLGAVSQEAIVSTPIGVFFWDRKGGAYAYDGRTPRWISEPLHSAIVAGSINATSTKTNLAWVNNRLWCNVWFVDDIQPVGVLPLFGPNRTLVFNPASGKSGTWMNHGFPNAAGSTTTWGTYTNVPIYNSWHGQVFAFDKHLAWTEQNPHLVRLDVDATTAVDTLSPSVSRPIFAVYRTPWYDLGQLAVRKRWRRPDIVVKDVPEIIDTLGGDFVFKVKMDRDYRGPSESTVSRYKWWHQPGDRNFDVPYSGKVVERGNALGLGRSVQLQLIPQGAAWSSGADWGVQAIALKYIPRRVR
jgi:hypothetical protein